MPSKPKHSKDKRKDNRSLLQRLLEDYATGRTGERRNREAIDKATKKK